MSQKCGYPSLPGITEWTCNGTARYIVVGVHGSGWSETLMPRCEKHVQPTVAGLNPPDSPYPHESFRRVEWIDPAQGRHGGET